MIKTLALLLDSYRELNAKKLFWIVLALSGGVVLIVGALGLNGEAVTIFGWKSPFRFGYLAMLSHATFYKILFTAFGVNIWLTGLASILALISTAGIFPDFLAGGSVDIYLSKPISRLRLFLTKYVGALLFVASQVLVFTLAAFIILGVRGGSWEPSIFIAVPLVVLMFSYLYSICVLLGVLTRSTVASLMLTLLIWCVLWVVNTTEVGLLQAQLGDQRQAASLDKSIARVQGELDGKLPLSSKTSSTTAPTTDPADDEQDAEAQPTTRSWWGWLPGGSSTKSARLRARLAELKTERQQLNADRFVMAHNIAYGIAFALPKTSGTIELLTRELIKRADLPKVEDPQPAPETVDDQPEAGGHVQVHQRRQEQMADARDTDIALRSRSAGWILGTSCTFEAVVLGLAAWMFCRRDY